MNGLAGLVEGKERFRVTTEIAAVLEKAFVHNMYPDRAERQHIANMVNASERQIIVWFQNRRSREKRKSRECGGEFDEGEAEPPKRAPPPGLAPPSSKRGGEHRAASCDSALFPAGGSSARSSSSSSRSYSIDMRPGALLDDLDKVAALDFPFVVELSDADFALDTPPPKPASPIASATNTTQSEPALPIATPTAMEVVVSSQAPHAILWATSTWSDWLGYNTHDVVGRPLTAADGETKAGPRTSPSAVSAIAGAASKAMPWEGAVISFTASGEPFTHTLRAEPLRDESGKAQCVQLVYSDMQMLLGSVNVENRTARRVAEPPAALPAPPEPKAKGGKGSKGANEVFAMRSGLVPSNSELRLVEMLAMYS